jgi:hypothetical protein
MQLVAAMRSTGHPLVKLNIFIVLTLSRELLCKKLAVATTVQVMLAFGGRI